MKLVVQLGKKVIKKEFDELSLDEIISWIKHNFKGHREPSRHHELYRYKIEPKGVAVIYRDNRKIRSSNIWFEIRALVALAKKTGLSFFHRKQFRIDSYTTEIDGINTENKIMVEVKKTEIDQKWVDFYDKKRKKLGFRKVIIVAEKFSENIMVPKTVSPYQIKIDWGSPHDYYNSLTLPDWLENLLPPRHVRFFLPNGTWTGNIRKLTKTAKYSVSDKLKRMIFRLIKKKRIPIKIYYTMARMVNPVSEYMGKGYPMPYLICVFDVDVPEVKSIITKNGYILKNLSIAKENANIISEYLNDLGYETRIFYSGVKGYHVYAFKNGAPLEIRPDTMLKLVKKIGELSDNIYFKSKTGFDVHRIIKLPFTVDLSTGQIISEKDERLTLDDKLILYDS